MFHNVGKNERAQPKPFFSVALGREAWRGQTIVLEKKAA
jgi:hypothetical protein